MMNRAMWLMSAGAILTGVFATVGCNMMTGLDEPTLAHVCGDGVVAGDELCDPGVDACCNELCTGPIAADSECRPAVGACDVAEVCDGTSFACPADIFQPDATPCPDDGDACTDDMCQTGTCSHPAAAVVCGDGHRCGVEECDDQGASATCTASCTICALGSDRSCPAASCKAILDAGQDVGDGLYWIDPSGASPVQAMCDMTTEGGGWTRVFGYHIVDESLAVVTAFEVEAGLVAAASGMGHIAEDGLASLRAAGLLTELRFECSKPSVGRKLHIVTSAEPVLDWFTGVSDVQPQATGSFSVLADDTSWLAMNPSDWGYTNGNLRVDRWGAAPPGINRFTDHTMFMPSAAHWLMIAGRQECDDHQPTQGTDNNGTWFIWAR